MAPQQETHQDSKLYPLSHLISPYPILIFPSVIMRFSSPLAALTVLSALGLIAASDVLDLTAKSFKAEVMGEDLALVEFFAPCKL